jgi:hypothetical protein
VPSLEARSYPSSYSIIFSSAVVNSTFCEFDRLSLNARDVRDLPLIERKGKWAGRHELFLFRGVSGQCPSAAAFCSDFGKHKTFCVLLR